MSEEFVIRIRADDAATATIKKIQAALGKVTAPVDKAQKRFASIGSVGMRSFEKLTKGIGAAVRAAHSLVDKVVELVPGLAAIGAAGTVAGIVGLTSRFGNFGFELSKTSKLLGMNAQDLAAWHVAAKRAGVAASEFDSAMSSSQMKIRSVAFGGDPHAQVLAQRMGVDIRPNKDGSIDYYAIQMRLMKAIQGQRSVEAQREAAETFGYGALLPMLQQGTYNEDKARALRKGLVPTADELARATQFKQDINDLEDSVSGLGNGIGSRLVPILDPVVKKFAQWLDAHRVEIADKLADAVQRFVDWISKIDWNEVSEKAQKLWDDLGGVKDVMIAIAALTFAAPLAGLAAIALKLGDIAAFGTNPFIGSLVGGVTAESLRKRAFDQAIPAGPDHDQQVAEAMAGGAVTPNVAQPPSGGWGKLGVWWQKHFGGGEAGVATANSNALFAKLEDQYKLPPHLLDSVWATESGRGKHMLSPAGALGHFQFLPKTAAQYGLQDPNDLEQSATAAARMYSDLLKANGGNLERALAGYNWGQGNVDRRGLGAAPSETLAYIDQVEGRMGMSPQASEATRNTRVSDMQKQAVNITLDVKNMPQGARAEAKTDDGSYLPTRVAYRLDGI
ncbi:transglycosylase SLT domain-containing protein [Burkholderia gladioli]|uniref:lytic transglycosylase domain-containing protein n=1 Tax=Burkholderia gladioli TaxID=28095 RepID=UPI00163E6CCB|nr:lytic transglycosylase domain-containing protein [Burkholderia gladioli]